MESNGNPIDREACPWGMGCCFIARAFRAAPPWGYARADSTIHQHPEGTKFIRKPGGSRTHKVLLPADFCWFGQCPPRTFR